MKKFIKKIIIFILHKIRTILTLIRDHALPLPRKKDWISYKFYLEDQLKDSYANFKDHFPNCMMFSRLEELQNHAFKFAHSKRLDGELFLEFGVWNGTTINQFAKHDKKLKIYGFDSFVGLKDDWIGMVNVTAGTCDLGGVIPKLEQNVIPIKGWIEETLPVFLEKIKEI